MTVSPPSTREPLTDSPWFWVYLFATVALILLVVWRPKLEYRQAWIERQHQARTLSTREASDAASPPLEVSTPDNTVIQLDFLYTVLGVLVVGGWIGLWYVRYRRGQPSPDKPKR